MGKQDKVPAAPDYTSLIKASQAQSANDNKLQQQQFDWAKQAYADNKTTSDKVAAASLDNMAQQNAAAKEAQDRYTNVAVPLQDSFIQDANDYDTSSRRDLNMGAAQAGVASSYDAARENAQRDLESYGINPSATRFAALDVGARTAQAAATAAAGTTASLQTEATGRDLKAQAINMLSGLPAQVSNDVAGGNNSGSTASGTGLNTTASGGNTMGTSTQYGALAGNALSGTAAATAQNYNNQMGQYNAQYQQDTSWMPLLGTALGVGAHFIPGFATGGAIPTDASPSHGAIPDDTMIRATPGEFVLPADTVRWLGEAQIHKMISKAANDRASAMTQPAGAIPTTGQPLRQAA